MIARYARTSRELDNLLHRFCLQCVGDYAKVDSTPVLQFALVTALEEFLDEDATNDGTVCLFDTKSLGSDENAARKHNGLWEYLQELRQRYPERKFMGGIIIEDRKLWKFSRHQLADNFSNLDGWDEFIPASVLQSPDFVESEYWMDDWDG